MKRLLLLVPCAVALCALNVTAACVAAQEAPSPLPPLVEETVVAQPALLDQLRNGTMTAEEAWDKKLLDEKSALALLEGGSVASWEDDARELRVALFGTLMKHAPQQIETAAKMSLRLQRALADYYADADDERAVALYEGLAARDEYSPYEKAVLLETLGKWQKSRGNAAAAVTALDRAREWFLKAKQPHGAASSLVEMAQVYLSLDDEAKAEKLYAQVPQDVGGWATPAALWGLGRLLIRQDRHEEVRRLLQQPLTGRDQAERRVVVASLLADSYYRAGEFQAAEKQSEAALALYEALPIKKPFLGLDVVPGSSSERLVWIKEWAQHPFVCWPPKIELKMDGAKLGAQEINVRSFRQIPMNLAVDDSKVKAQVKGSWQQGEGGFYFDQEVTVEAAPEAGRQAFDTTLTVTSLRFPDFKERVQIHVEAQPVH